ncbi:MAG: ABC transporter permease [Bacteroidetes bacterium]|nr:MAG: ABC transporter permease [Bacteroidota bacterium]
MFKNYFNTAVRNLWKHKSFSLINITGLTIGLTSFILIALYIFDELTFDSFHKNADNIFRVVENKTSAEGKTTRSSGTGYQVSAKALSSLPEIKDAARVSSYFRARFTTVDNKTKSFYEDYIAASPGFLTVFDFPLLDGDRNTALTEPNSVILTEESAKKYFGTADAVGKLLVFEMDTVPYKVTAVLKNFPANSSISFNLAVSEANIQNNPNAKGFFENDWNSGAFATYFLLKDKTDISALNNKLNDLNAANRKDDPGIKTKIQLQALKDVHFYSGDIEGRLNKKGNIAYIYVFLIVAFFIIFIACINYMNLSTARFTNRGKEIAVRKVTGASRTSLIKQFMVEIFLVMILSVIISIVLVNLSLPAFNSFTEKHLNINLHTDFRIWTGIILITMIVALLAGLYPALFQSGLNPLSLLKGKIHLGRANISLRRSLVVFQFIISIVLISATMIIYEQMQFVNNKDLGFDKDKLVVIDLDQVRHKAVTIKNEFEKLAQVKSVSISTSVPGEWKIIPTVKVNNDNSNPTSGKDMYFFGVDDQFISTYDIKLIKGRNFYSSGNVDSTSVLINETAAKELGITNPLNQPISIPAARFGGDNRSGVDRPFNVMVAGIVKDFNFQSLHDPLAPMILGFQKNPIQGIEYFTVKLAGGDFNATLEKMKTIMKTVGQDDKFEFHFLDKQWDLLYHEDKIRQTVFLVVAMLAIFIAALGLLGLTIYTAEQRVKEIGVRKVLGASVNSIALMLSKDFLKLVLIAALIAIPVAWYFMNKWLEDFAYRIKIEGWVFLLSALVAIIIAMATICFQVVKAAIANPVKSLRTE